jgi:hypothetical protein
MQKIMVANPVDPEVQNSAPRPLSNPARPPTGCDPVLLFGNAGPLKFAYYSYLKQAGILT